MSKKIAMVSTMCKRDELTCLVCSIDEFEKRERSAPSNFHHRILKCRLLIFSMCDILASPNYKSSNELFVIFNRQITDNIELLEHIEKINLKIIMSIPVDNATHEACFKYTLIAKMAPMWNLVQTNILIKGRDFLYYSSPQNAVIFNVFIFESNVILEIECIKIHLSLVKPKNLDVTQKNLDYFSGTSNSYLSEYSIYNQWTHILPSLKKGKIISINRNIPKSSLFSNYKDLRRHWKNIYGYRLPEDDSGINYYEIYFKPLGPQLYTYPSICLLTNYPTQITPPLDCINEIANSFKADVNKRLSQLLGHNMSFDILDKNYHIESEEFSSINTINIEECKKMLEKNRIIVEDDTNEYPYPKIINNTTVSEKNYRYEDNFKFDNNISKNTCFTQNLSLCTPTQNSESNNKYIPKFEPKKKTCVQSSMDNYIENLSFNVDKLNHSNVNVIESNNCLKSKPIFETNKNTSQIKKRKNESPSENGHNIKHTSWNNNCSVVENGFTNKQNIFPNNNFNNRNLELNDNFKKEDLKTFGSISIQKYGNYNDNNFNKGNLVVLLGQQTHEEKGQQHVLKYSNNTISQEYTASNNKIKNSIVKQEIPAKSVTSNNEPDISLLARTNFDSLKKLTVRTLLLWLRSQNVHATTKMTKQQLLDKIRDHLKL